MASGESRTSALGSIKSGLKSGQLQGLILNLHNTDREHLLLKYRLGDRRSIDRLVL